MLDDTGIPGGWKPTSTIKDIVRAVQELLDEPDFAQVVNDMAAGLHGLDRDNYDAYVLTQVADSLKV